MDLKMARQLYEQAGGMISMASTIGRDLDITTLEDAALGDAEATKRVTRINAELASMQGLSLGAAQKDGNIVGLTEDQCIIGLALRGPLNRPALSFQRLRRKLVLKPQSNGLIAFQLPERKSSGKGSTTARCLWSCLIGKHIVEVQMEEFDAPGEHGVKQMRETIDRKDDTIKKLEAELASYKDKEIDNVFGKLGLSTDKGFGKALKQVYDGPVNTEAVAQFAKDEYGFEPTGMVEATPQAEPEQVVQDDARSRVAALDANSTSDVPLDVNQQLAQVLKGASVKDSLRAKLNIMDDVKNNK